MYTHLCAHYFYFIISSLAPSARRAEPLLTGTEISAYSWKHSYFNQTTLPIFHSSFYSPAFVKSANQPARSFPSPITSFFLRWCVHLDGTVAPVLRAARPRQGRVHSRVVASLLPAPSVSRRLSARRL